MLILNVHNLMLNNLTPDISVVNGIAFTAFKGIGLDQEKKNKNLEILSEQNKYPQIIPK